MTALVSVQQMRPSACAPIALMKFGTRVGVGRRTWLAVQGKMANCPMYWLSLWPFAAG